MLRSLALMLESLFLVIFIITFAFGVGWLSDVIESHNWKDFSTQHDCKQLQNIVVVVSGKDLKVYSCDNATYHIR